MFFSQQPAEYREKYKSLLRATGALSKLFSDSDIPYLYYRASENIFCKAFNAVNLSRSDCSADAKKNIEGEELFFKGIGIKTFLEGSGTSFQKVAEFNKQKSLYDQYIETPELFIKTIAKLRNNRIGSTMTIHGISDMIYHCITRSKNRFKIHEEKMNFINTENITDLSFPEDKTVFDFNDGQDEYKFYVSKSTLFKKFKNTPEDNAFDVNIIDDPYDLIENFNVLYSPIRIEPKKQVILPLYSPSSLRVSNRSGLNHWNASGRPRDPNEVYIPVPAKIHQKYPGFFPERDVQFNLKLPNSKTLLAKICQQGNKALMSNPNRDLGKWILRDILKLEEGTLVTYSMLQEIGIDSVEVLKNDDENYEINFKELGTFELFKNKYLN